MNMLDTFSGQARGVAYMYDSWATRYDIDVTQYHTYTAPEMVADAILQCARADSENILDLGTGTGLVLERLKSAFGKAAATGLDVSDRMLDKARAKFHRTAFYQCDIESAAWPVEKGSVDIITSAGVLSMIGNLDHVLDQARETLKPDGVGAFSFFIRNDFVKGPGLATAGPFKTHTRTSEEMEQALDKHGFKLVKPIETFRGYGSKFFMERHGLAVFAPK